MRKLKKHSSSIYEVINKTVPKLKMGVICIGMVFLTYCDNASIEDIDQSESVKIDNLEQFNQMITELSAENNIHNSISLLSKSEITENNRNSNPFEYLPNAQGYEILHTDFYEISNDGVYAGILYVGSLPDNEILVYHELPNGDYGDMIKVNAYETSQDIWTAEIDLLTSLSDRDMTREECEQQTTDLVMAGTAFTGLTGWWCPPCAFAGSVATGIVALGYFTCRL